MSSVKRSRCRPPRGEAPPGALHGILSGPAVLVVFCAVSYLVIVVVVRATTGVWWWSLW